MKITKIQTSNINPWWNNGGEDFPSLSYLDSFFRSFKDSEYKINFISHYKAQMVINLSDIKNIGSVRIFYEDNIDTQTYIIKSIDKVMENGTAILNLEIDIYASYGHKIFNSKYMNNRFLTKRSHIFNPLYFQMQDNLLDAIPIYYNDNYILEKMYPTDSNGYVNIMMNSSAGLIKTSFKSYINANIYYVFGCGIDIKDTTKFTMIPLMSITETLPIIKTPSTTPITLENIKYSDDNWNSILERIKYWEGRGYKDIYMNVKSEFNFQSSTEKIDITDYPFRNNPIYIYFNKRQYRRSDPNFLFWQNWSFTEHTLKVTLNGDTNYRNMKKTEGVWKSSGSQNDFLPYPPNDYWDPSSNRRINIELRGSPAGFDNKSVLNKKSNLDGLLKDPELVNKFQGIYFFPNIANFTITTPDRITGKFKDYVLFEIGAEGINLNNFAIADQILLSNIQEEILEWNDTEITSIYFLKYLDISYYNNLKDWNFYYDYDNSSIKLNGKFFFNGNGLIISNVGIDKTYNNIFNFPYQLPSAIDKYIQYYSSIMSSINTGIEGQKKSYEISKNQNTTNALTNGISGAMGLIGNMVSGNVAGTIGSAVGLGGNIANSVFNRQSLDLQNEMYYKRLGSQFADVQRTQSTSFNNSASTDISFIYANFGEKNAEHIQLRSLTENSIINVNNMIYLYGYQNIGWYTLNDLMLYDTFNYMEFESNEMTRFILNNLEFKIKEYYDIVINFWNTGKRIWNSKPSYQKNKLSQKYILGLNHEKK